MRSLVTPGINAQDFLRRAMADGYSMQDPFIDPGIGTSVSRELERAGYLRELAELNPTEIFEEEGMPITHLLHQTVNEAISNIEGVRKNHIPLFSVRVFKAGEYGTDIHRNHFSVGPWVVGVTLNGEAPFNVYYQEQLPERHTISLVGDRTDPDPADTMNARAGSAWALYTGNEQTPHSSGDVTSPTQRELIIFYNTTYNY